VRPSGSARKLADNEEIEIRLYSIIYDAINDVKAAMEGMLEKGNGGSDCGNAEVRKYSRSRSGNCGRLHGHGRLCKAQQPYTVDPRLYRSVFRGNDGPSNDSQEDASEVKAGFDCGISIKNFSDIKVGDVIESYENREVKKVGG